MLCSDEPGGRRGASLWAVTFLVSVCILVHGSTTAGAGAHGPDGWEVHELPWEVETSFDLSFVVSAPASGRLRIGFGPADGTDLVSLDLGPEGIRYTDMRTGSATWALINPTGLVNLTGCRVVFQQRPHRWALVSGGDLLAGSNSPLEAGWRMRFAALKGAGEVNVSQVRYQRQPGVRFTDGFMRTGADPSSWEEVAGEWSLDVAPNPLLSANAFCYHGVGRPRAVAVAGDYSWSDYAFDVACRPAPGGAAGIFVCYRGPDEWYLFRWTSQDSTRPCKQVVRARAGEETVLAELPGGYSPGQWYTFRALVGAGWARFSIDDKPLFLIRDSGITSGRIGLCVEGEGMASFDDVVVETRTAFLAVPDDRQTEGALTSGGEWMLLPPAPWEDRSSGHIAVRTDGPARLIWPGTEWSDFALSAHLAPWRDGALGLVFGYGDDLHFYSLLWEKSPSGSRLALSRADGMRSVVLAERAVADDDAEHDLAVLSRDGTLNVMVDGAVVLTRSDPAQYDGRVGLMADDAPQGLFSRVMCEALSPLPPIPRAARDAFAAEPAQMQTWAGTVSDWTLTAYREGMPRALSVWWHRLEFFDDVQVAMRLEKPLRNGEEVGILLDGDGNEFGSAYLALIRPADPEGMMRVEVSRGGRSLDSTTVNWPAGPMSFAFRRAGSALCVVLGGRQILHLPDAPPGAGRRIGWYAVPAEDGEPPVSPADIDIYSGGVVNETFDLAPTDWRIGGGVWDMSNKWQCDPRWSFFSGQSNHLAAIWFKRPLHGDFSIEYFVGNKMMRERGQKYEYAQDMNLSFCADGEDLGSGYTFLFGGYDNTVTALYRKGKEFAAPVGGKPILINRSGALHRHWYHIKVSRKGSLLQAWIDGALVLSREDPDPLPDGHFAIWTYNNGIMIARVRISAEGIGPREDPDLARGPTKQPFYTVYDRIAKGADGGD